MIIGYGRHGKDTVCEFLRDEYGYTFESSSQFCAERVVRQHMADLGITYETAEECYADRHNHRSEWFNAIKAYSAEDRTRLTREIFDEYDIYCGMRNAEELNAVKQLAPGLIDLTIWVDASDRHPPEEGDSCTVTAADADFVLDNNGDLDGLLLNIRFLMGNLAKYGVDEFKTRGG